MCNNTKLYVYITEREEWQIYIIKTESQNHCTTFKNNTSETKERLLLQLPIGKSKVVKSHVWWLSLKQQIPSWGGTYCPWGLSRARVVPTVGGKAQAQTLQRHMYLLEHPAMFSHLPVSFCKDFHT